MAVQSFPTTYTLGEFDSKNLTTVPDQYVVAFEKQIEQGEAVGLGRGYAQTQTDAEGRLYAAFVDSADASTVAAGRVRYTVRTRQGRLVSVLNEYDISEIQSGSAAADRPDRHPFAIQRFNASGRINRWIAYPFVLCVEIQLSSAITLDGAASEMKADGKRAERTA